MIRTDLHTHILPGIDDGPTSVEDSITMIDILLSQGVENIVLTPHYNPETMSVYEFLEQRNISYNNLLSNLGNRKINLILGAEVVCSMLLLNTQDLFSLCIEGTRYMLIELHPYIYDKKFPNFLDELKNKGIIPIMAHSERNVYFKRRFKLLYDFSDLGCIFQLNVASLTDRKLKRHSCKLIKKGIIDVIATDCHDLHTRPPILTDAVSFISEYLSEKELLIYENNAIKIIHNQTITKKRM